VEFFVFLCVVIVGIVVWIVFAVKYDKQREVEYRESEERRQKEYEEQRAHQMKALALTCRRCRKLAPPIPGTGNRYRCNECGNQFAGAAHRM